MQITKIVDGQQMPSPEEKRFSAEELEREFDYYMAQKLLKSLLDAGLILEGEFDKITALNRKSFSPFLIEIMP